MGTVPSDSAEHAVQLGGDGTKDLLRGILAELKNIGGQLQQQDQRLSAVENQFRANASGGHDASELVDILFFARITNC